MRVPHGAVPGFVGALAVVEDFLGLAPVVVWVDGDEVWFAVWFLEVVGEALFGLSALFLVGVWLGLFVSLELDPCLLLDVVGLYAGVVELDLCGELLDELLVGALCGCSVEVVVCEWLEAEEEAEDEGDEDEDGGDRGFSCGGGGPVCDDLEVWGCEL